MMPSRKATVCIALAALLGLQLFNNAPAHNVSPTSARLNRGFPSVPLIQYANDLVTLHVHDTPIRVILEELVQAANLVLMSEDSLEERITLELRGRSLSDTIRAVLRGYSYALQQTAARSINTAGRHQEQSDMLWVYRGASPVSSQNDSPGSASALGESDAQDVNNDVLSGRMAVKEARKLVGDAALAPLTLALTDESARVRVEAIYGLASLGGDEAVSALAAALADENPGVRAEAAYALGQTGSASAVQFLQYALRDTDRDVRESAIEALVRIGGLEASTAIETQLRDPDPLVRRTAVEALRDTETKTAIDNLSTALDDENIYVKQIAKEALVELSGNYPAETAHVRFRSPVLERP